ncbi:2OG-Fe(II) oxygenase family protein [Nocardia sp. NPDC050406]|uniref:2OG-Fe(II) oxygenase family protein n=1 Tax=Nocardia sp. NPDC050406 TaxID=3364318 RepID=UPI00379EFBD2
MGDQFRVPTLDAAGLRMDRAGFGIRLRDALHDTGVCYLTGAEIRRLPVADVLTATREYFAGAPESGVVDFSRLREDATTSALRQVVSEWAWGLAELSTELLGALAQALGQPEDWFDRRVGREVRPQLLHARPNPEGAVHGDTGFLTFLLPDLLCGLRIGDDLEVAPRENAVLLTLGPAAESATAGYLRAVPHRMWSPHAHKSRVGVTVAVGPSGDAPN